MVITACERSCQWEAASLTKWPQFPAQLKDYRPSRLELSLKVLRLLREETSAFGELMAGLCNSTF